MKFAGDEDLLKVFDKALSSIRGVSKEIDVDIRDNFLSDKRLNGIIHLINNNPLIKELTLILTCNFITDKGFKEIVTAISSSCRDLQKLTIDVNWNYHIKNTCIEYISDCVASLTKLEKINIKMSKQTRVTLEGENKFKMMILSHKRIRLRIWNGAPF